MQIDARVEGWASLQLIPGISARALVALLKAFGGPAEVLAASRNSLGKWVSGELATAILRGADPAEFERTLAWLAEPGHALVAWDDPAYPQALLTITDPPPVLHYAGKLDLLNRPALAIVGSRNATPQGRENAQAFAGALSAAGLTIVSGLAQGIDAAAHRGGLAGVGNSVAVVGTGIDRIYPATNETLAHRLAAKRRHAVPIHAGHAASAGKLSPPQSCHQRFGAGRAGGRGDPEQRIADHRAVCGGAGARRVRHPRLDSFTVFQRLPSADQGWRQAR